MTRIWDQPTGRFAGSDVAGGATRVVSRVHVNTYLVVSGVPRYRVAWTVTYTSDGRNISGPVYEVTGGGAVTEVDAAQNTRMKDQMPRQQRLNVR
jgi:hypothetical protein